MFCPVCKVEYNDGVTRCRDCDMELVDSMPAGGSDYKVVAVVQGRLEEEQIRSFLESNGIPSEVRGEAFRNVYGLTVDGMGAVEIMVPQNLASKALELIASANHGDLTIDDADIENSNQTN